MSEAIDKRTLTVDPRIERAATLPSAAYNDPAVLELEKRSVFGRSWNLIGRLDQTREPGDFFTATIADEPVIVVRDKSGSLRAFSNVCRHRAGPVAAGEGNRKSFQCGYHGWTYSLDGRLSTTPEFDGVECFSKEGVCLPEFNVDTWGPLVFANLSSGGPSLLEV